MPGMDCTSDRWSLGAVPHGAATFGWAAGPFHRGWLMPKENFGDRGHRAPEQAARVPLPGSFPARCGQLRRRAEPAIPIHAIPPARFEKADVLELP